jgi:hypothetical protein
MTATEWLQRWYKQACDGLWEHAHGIKIDTLDNPGWEVRIDLPGALCGQKNFHKSVENSETDWLRCSIENDQFVGYGDPGKLEELLLTFKEWIESQEDR